ncbi:hypothetical protein V6N11_017329 [Hibiscus sabdariffa]|uniref:Uncharacterized protein n=1 Tax=Hibiscus sabdariffa TaxID=183260 RepID=A0ABR2TXQ7_9ROSI
MNLWSCSKKDKQRLPIGSWVAPSVSTLEFNVDDVVKRSFGEANIGCILRDYKGSHLVHFSKSIGLLDLTGADLGVIREACLEFSNCRVG